MLNSGFSCLMSKILEQVTVLVFLYIILKQSFDFFPSFVLGCKSVWRTGASKFSSQYFLSCPPITILCLCVSFLSFSSYLTFLILQLLPWNVGTCRSKECSIIHPKKVALDRNIVLHTQFEHDPLLAFMSDN